MTHFKMKYQIVADAAKAKAEVKSFDDLLQGAGSRIGTSIGGPAVAAAVGVAAIGGAAVTAGVALFNLTKTAADYGSAIYDASKKTGLHAESLSAMDFAAKQSGTSLETITGGVAKFAKTVGEAADGSDKAAAKLKAFAIDPKEAINDLDGALGTVFKKIIEAPPGIERMTLAQKAFGKSGADLLPFLDSFDGDLDGLIKKAKALGVTIDDEAAKAADDFGDQLDTLNSQLSGVARTIGTELMPEFTTMARDVSAWLQSNPGEVQKWGESIAYIIRRVAAGVREAATNWEALKDIVDTFTSTDPAAVDAYLERAQRRDVVREEIRNIVAGTDIRGNWQQDDEFAAWKAGKLPLAYKRTGGGDDDDNKAGGAKKRSASGDNRTDKQVYQDFVAELKKLGVTINSGFRTYAEQAALYAKLPRGQAAVPGTSDHEFYRAVDLPPGVSQAVIEKAARAAGVTLGKRNVHEGTGLHNHQAFRKGRSTGGGEDAAYDEAAAARKDLEDLDREIREGLRDMAADMIAADEQASEKRLTIRQKEADQAVVMIEGMVQRGELTELESIQRLGQLKLDMLEEEQKELQGQIPTEKNLQRLEELRLEIGTQRLQNTNEEHGYWQKITDEINKQNAALEKRNKRPTTLTTRQNPIGNGSFGDQLDDATGRVRTMDDVMHQLGSTATEVFMQMGQALGASVEAWVLLGDNADISLQRMVASTLAGVAAQSAVLAVFHLAMGIAALTPWGAAIYGPAPLHFKAAAIWGAIAVGTALAGRAVAGDSGKSSSKGRSSSSSSSSNDRPVEPYSRQSDDVYISGRREQHIAALASAVDKLQKKIGGMNPGDVLVAGARQRRGFIGTQAVDDMKTRPQLGSRLLRQTNAR